MSQKVIAIQDSQKVADAVTMMAREQVGFLMVTGDDGKLVGVVSDTDLVRKVLHKKMDPGTMQVKEIMFPNPITTTPQTELVDAVDTLCEHHLS